MYEGAIETTTGNIKYIEIKVNYGIISDKTCTFAPN